MQKTNLSANDSTRVTLGAEVFVENPDQWLSGKRIAVVANQASLVFGQTHLVDTLLKKGVKIQKVFAPEHGFRGDKEAGEFVSNDKDRRTGLPLISLHGAMRKPKPEHLSNVDAVVFDIQDVGTRFYTYLTTLAYVMEACAENGKTLIVLDRPNPNGRYVDGPVMENAHKTFLGLHNIPIVHGMTFGEYARMANYEGWLAGGKKCKLIVVEMKGYRHEMRWRETGREWIAPSPNLQSPEAAEYYPFLCWFEATCVSEGRGTDAPFQTIGFPYHHGIAKHYRVDSSDGTSRPIRLPHLQAEAVKYTPRSIPKVAANPKYQDTLCWGLRFKDAVPDTGRLFIDGLELLQNFSNEYAEYCKARPCNRPFFTRYFENLSGTPALREAILRKDKPETIWKSWQPKIEKFKTIRAKYLLYP